MSAYLLVLALLSVSPAAAAEPADAAQRRCFCVKVSAPGVMPPYFLGRMDSDECRERKLDFLDGRTVYDLALLNCDDLEACLSISEKERLKSKLAAKKVTGIIAELQDCCSGSKENCSKACVEKYEPLLNKAKTKAEKLHNKTLRRQDACIAKKPPVQAPAQEHTAPTAAPLSPTGASN